MNGPKVPQTQIVDGGDGGESPSPRNKLYCQLYLNNLKKEELKQNIGTKAEDTHLNWRVFLKS
jgi:hypothetical protein